MDKLTLYRGIAVPQVRAAEVIATIHRTGMTGTEGNWAFKIPDITDVRARLDVLYSKEDLCVGEIFAGPQGSGFCACGTVSGAEYYALRHNFSAGKDDCSIVIEFEADLVDTYVDCRDFLCTAFQLWDRSSELFQAWQSSVLQQLFGAAITRYFVEACRTKEQSRRIAMCNLAALDPDVLRAHLANTKVIAGRYGTHFENAVFVKAPVPANRIRRVYTHDLRNEVHAARGMSRSLAR